MAGKIQPVSLGPLSGLLDARTFPEQMDTGSVRYRQNWQMSAGRMQRAQGWARLLSGNADLHDQLLQAMFYYDEMSPASEGSEDATEFPSSLCGESLLTRVAGRQHITLLFPSTQVSGERRLIVGTQQALYELNETAKNFRILADGLGGATLEDLSIRFRAAQIKDTVVFTNNYDDILSYKIGDEILGCAMRATRRITDLDLIGLGRAYHVAAFKGFMLLMNFTLDGARIENGVVWSDVNAPTSYDPAKIDSIVDNVILAREGITPGHRILNSAPLGGALMIYTTKGIWACNTTGSDPALSFDLVYEHPEGERCLSYPNSLVNKGDSHHYAGRDGFYKIDQFSFAPERSEWLHKASNLVFSDLSATCCESFVGGFQTSGDPANDEDSTIWFSWPQPGSCVPSRSLTIQPEAKFVSVIDAGFTAFCNFQSDPRLTVRDFFREICACTGDDLASDYIKEGLPINPPECATQPTVIYSLETQTVDGYTTENWDADSASDGSLCSILAGRRAADFCAEGCATPLFIGALSTDMCLKQIGGTYGREICVNANSGSGVVNGFAVHTFDGIYSSQGCTNIVRLGPLTLGDAQEKVMHAAELMGIESEPSTTTAVVAIRVGASDSPLDANREDCGVLWGKYLRKKLECVQRLMPEEYAAKNLRPQNPFYWAVMKGGRYFYIEIVIAGLINPNDINSALFPAIGTKVSIGTMTVKAQAR